MVGEIDRELLDRAFQVVADGVGDGSLDTAVLAVASRDRLIRAEASGNTSLDRLYLLASVTKPVFCSSVMRLVEEGRARLNDPVSRFIPEFAAGPKAAVTLWHLLTHTSGLDESAMAQAMRDGTANDAILASLNAPVMFRPGSHYSYCNASYYVMAEIIRLATGQDHATYIGNVVLAPLGMRDTGYAPRDADRAVPVLDMLGNDPSAARFSSFRLPAGGLWSTAADLIRFGQAFLKRGANDNGRFLAPATIKTMTSLHTGGIPKLSANGEFPSGYGLGWEKPNPGGEAAPSIELTTPSGHGHGGATGTLLWIEPDVDLVFVFLTNRWGHSSPHARSALNAAIAAFSATTA